MSAKSMYECVSIAQAEKYFNYILDNKNNSVAIWTLQTSRQLIYHYHNQSTLSVTRTTWKMG